MVALAVTSRNGSKTLEARYETPRTPGRKTFGHRVAEVAEKLGRPFMPWQQHWALVCGELIRDEESGLWVPAYPEAFATMMRQQGKTHWMWCHGLDRCVLWESYDGKPQAVAATGQTGLEERKKFRKELWPQLQNSKLRPTVEKPRFMAEDTGLTFVNGADFTIWSNSQEAGHGSVIDLASQDEIWADIDDRRDSAVSPAMLTRHDRQKIVASTGGTDRSLFYLSKRAAGRAAVMEGRTEGMAYLEFSADPEDPDYDPEDPKLWRSCMPALGHTITERDVRTLMEDLLRQNDGDYGEWERAGLNITRRTGGERVIPNELWIAVLKDAAPASNLVIGVDGQPEQEAASIAVVDGDVTCEVAAHADGTSWLLPKLTDMAKSLKAKVVVDTAGPVGHLADQLEQRNVKVVRYQPRHVAHACAEFYERVADGPSRIKIRPSLCDHCGQVPITAAVEGATRQPHGDGWKWSRKSVDVDISPLMATTLAVGVQAGIGAEASEGKVLFAWGN